MKIYVFRGSGHWLQCEVVVVADGIKNAIHLIREKLEENKLLDKNEPITEQDISEFSIDTEKVVFFYNGDY